MTCRSRLRPGALAFRRTYVSQAADRYNAPLSPGWTHNQDIRLIFPDDDAGLPGYTLFKSPSGNIYRFKDNGGGSYSAHTGFPAGLTRSGAPYVYTLTESNQDVYTFAADGRLQTRADAQDRTTTYSYAGGLLRRVSADGNTRYLDFDYNQGRLASVTDQAGRSVSYGYDAAGDLVDVTDVLENSWHYVYNTAHQLTEARDPADALLVRNQYLAPVVESVDFDQHTISDYSGSSGANTTSVEDGGQTLHIVGNGRKKIDLPYPASSETILEFDYKSSDEGNLHAIGLDDDNTLDGSRAFKLYGADAGGFAGYDNYGPDAPGWKHYRIRLESIGYNSQGGYLYFINDDSSVTPTAESYFSNIQVYEAGTFGKVANQYDGNDNADGGLDLS